MTRRACRRHASEYLVDLYRATKPQEFADLLAHWRARAREAQQRRHPSGNAAGNEMLVDMLLESPYLLYKAISSQMRRASRDGPAAPTDVS